MLADKLTKKARIHWTEIRGEKVGVHILTIRELNEHIEALSAMDKDGGDRDVFALFANRIVEPSGDPAFTVDQMEEVLTNCEMKHLIRTFNEVNGIGKSETEKN